jgi:hypothetical protein
MKTFLETAAPFTASLTNELAKLCASEISVNPCPSVVENSPSSPCLSASVVAFVPLKFKYVIFRAQSLETASIIPPFAQHSDAINLAAKLPISAGFAWRDAGGAIHVEGESVSLKLKSRPEDAEIIRETLFMNGL